MKLSKELMLKAGITPKLRLGTKGARGVQSTGTHRIKFLEEKILMKPNERGQEVEYVRYIVEENGEKKQYDTKLRGSDGKPSYLVQRIADIEEGQEVIIEMKKRGIKNYVEVIPVNGSSPASVDDDEFNDEMPRDSEDII